MQTTQALGSASLRASAMNGIVTEVLAAFHGIPHHEAEIGGLLIGHYEDARMVVDEFEPVICEPRWGPSYILSEADLRGLEETLQWRRARPAGRPGVVGFYRSHTRGDGALDDGDRELFEKYFPDPRAIFLILKPDRQQQIAATWFSRSGTILARAAGPVPFPTEEPIDLWPAPVSPDASPGAQTPQPEDGVQPAAEVCAPAPPQEPEALRPVAPRRTMPPPTRPRLTAPSFTYADEAPSHGDRRWIAAVAALFVAAGILGYWSLGWRTPQKTNGPPAAATAPQPAPQVQSSAEAALPAHPVDKGTPQATTAPSSPAAAAAAAPVSPLPAIHLMLDQWSGALRSGNPNTIAAFYAPRVDSYFGERNVSSTAVARSLMRSAARYGKTVVMRLSDVRIALRGEHRAVATFRKHWQTSGAHVYSGVTEERLDLSKRDDGWKISSEQETRVIRTERVR